MHRKNIEHIVRTGTNDQMREMQDVMIAAISKLKESDRAAYNRAEFELHCIAHKGHLGEDLAKEWVECMENKDGTKGAHWSWEQAQQVKKDKGLDFDAGDWYAVLNMMWSDYYLPKFDTAIYIELAKDWLNDVDVGKDKTLKYYYYVVNAE